MSDLRLRAVFLATLAVCAVAFFLHQVGNSDLFWQLKTGEVFARTGAFLSRDVFSYTAEGARWINLEWLSGLLFFLVQQAAGFVGLSVLSLVFGSLLALMLFEGARRLSGSASVALLMTFLTFLAGAERFSELRAELFGYLCFAAMLLVLAVRARDRGLYLLLPIMVLWANMHPSAILGLFAVAAFFAFERKDAVARPVQRFALVTGLCFVAVLINPFTVQVYAFPFRELSQPFMLASSSDWHAPFFLHGAAMLAPWMFLGLALACALAFWLWKGGASPALALLSAALLIASLKVGRFIPFAMIALSFLFASLVRDRDRLRKAFETQSVRIAIVALCLVASMSAMKNGPLLGIRLHDAPRLMLGRTLGAGFDASLFPVQAVDFLEQKVVGAKPFNDMAWGGYLIWRLWPKDRVFIDTRTALYGDAFIKSYSDALFDERAFEALERQYGFNAIIYDAAQIAAPGGPLGFIATNPKWLEVLRTNNAVVYLKVKK
jgi:hypothetical protein